MAPKGKSICGGLENLSLCLPLLLLTTFLSVYSALALTTLLLTPCPPSCPRPPASFCQARLPAPPPGKVTFTVSGGGLWGTRLSLPHCPEFSTLIPFSFPFLCQSELPNKHSPDGSSPLPSCPVCRKSSPAKLFFHARHLWPLHPLQHY